MKGVQSVHRAPDLWPCLPTDSSSETLASHAYCMLTTHKYFLRVHTNCGQGGPFAGRKFVSVRTYSLTQYQFTNRCLTLEGDTLSKRRQPLTPRSNVTAQEIGVLQMFHFRTPTALYALYYRQTCVKRSHIMTPHCTVRSTDISNSSDTENI